MLSVLINLQDVLRHGGKKESVLKNTVKRLPVTLAIPFLKEVCCLHIQYIIQIQLHVWISFLLILHIFNLFLLQLVHKMEATPWR